MSGNAIHAGDGLTSFEARLKAVSAARTRHQALRDQVQCELDARQLEVIQLTKELDLLSKVTELFRHLMDQMIDKQVRAVERVGTEGLQTVFPDLDLSLEADVGPKYNKISVDFSFRRGVKGTRGSHRGHPLASFGGGPASLVSLILRVLTIRKMKLFPCLILDESLNAVSDDYVDHTCQFVQALARKLGFNVLLVTHKPSFANHTNLAYRCQELVESDGVTTYLDVRKIS